MSLEQIISGQSKYVEEIDLELGEKEGRNHSDDKQCLGFTVSFIEREHACTNTHTGTLTHTVSHKTL